MDGVLNIYKPVGITSFDVIRCLKKVCNTGKIGHTGTLDPLASGVLPVCIGKATKVVDLIMNDYKVYKAELKLGIVTDTYDREGKVLDVNDVEISKEEIESSIMSFVGEILQIPPMYSAIKIKGKKLYELARQGIEIPREPRAVTIYEIDILNINIPFVTFEVKCSKGTYIRSLCYDIGNKLGCGGVMWNLERLQSGNFTKDTSIEINSINADNLIEHLIPIDEIFTSFNKLVVDSRVERLLINGVRISNKHLINNVEENIMYRIYNEENKFLGLGSRNDIGFKIEKLLL
jgi:tRNA pseudouridine55 synthase